MFQSIRLRLLGLVLAAVVPFTALIGLGIWDQWRIEQAQALQYALSEARSVAAQVDDHVGDLENLLAGLTQAISTNLADGDATPCWRARWPNNRLTSATSRYSVSMETASALRGAGIITAATAFIFAMS